MSNQTTNSMKRRIKIVALVALSCVLVLGMTILCGCSSSKTSTANNTARNTTQSTSTPNHTNTSTSAKKVSSWEQAKGIAIQTWMTVHQTNLDNSELRYMDNGYGDHGYTVRCYIDHGTHIETIFLYAVSDSGRVYDLQLAKYVS